MSYLLNSASGVVRDKIETLFQNSVGEADRALLSALIYQPEETLQAQQPGIYRVEGPDGGTETPKSCDWRSAGGHTAFSRALSIFRSVTGVQALFALPGVHLGLIDFVQRPMPPQVVQVPPEAGGQSSYPGHKR